MDTVPDSVSPEGDGQRDGAGRFKPGNKCGKGNVSLSRVAMYRKAFHDAVSDEELAEVARAVLKVAKTGDVPAARFIADYTIGKPQAAEVSDAEAVEDVPNTLVVKFVRSVPPGG